MRGEGDGNYEYTSIKVPFMSGVFPTAVSSAVAAIVITVGMRTNVGRSSSQGDSR